MGTHLLIIWIWTPRFTSTSICTRTATGFWDLFLNSQLENVKKGRFFKQKLCVFWMWIFEPILTCHQEFAYIGWEIRHSKLPVNSDWMGKYTKTYFLFSCQWLWYLFLGSFGKTVVWNEKLERSIHPNPIHGWKLMKIHATCIGASLMSLLSKLSLWSLSLLEPRVKVHVQIRAAGRFVLLEVGEHLEVTKSKQNQNKNKMKQSEHSL